MSGPAKAGAAGVVLLVFSALATACCSVAGVATVVAGRGAVVRGGGVVEGGVVTAGGTVGEGRTVVGGIEGVVDLAAVAAAAGGRWVE